MIRIPPPNKVTYILFLLTGEFGRKVSNLIIVEMLLFGCNCYNKLNLERKGVPTGELMFS